MCTIVTFLTHLGVGDIFLNVVAKSKSNPSCSRKCFEYLKIDVMTPPSHKTWFNWSQYLSQSFFAPYDFENCSFSFECTMHFINDPFIIICLKFNYTFQMNSSRVAGISKLQYVTCTDVDTALYFIGYFNAMRIGLDLRYSSC